MQHNNKDILLNNEVLVDPCLVIGIPQGSIIRDIWDLAGSHINNKGCVIKITTNVGKAVCFIMFQIFIRTFELMCKQS